MEVKELRVGNIIRSKESGLFPGNTNTVEWYITEDDMINIIERGVDNYLPIPLSDEWLMKFGFKDVGYKSVFAYYKMKEDFIVYSDRKGHFWYNSELKNSTELKWLHQLQNLYFALSGEEL